jgi:ATP-dependent DNA ligase
MNYDEYTYLYPPRPETKIPRGMIGFYEKRGWWAQKKKNGTCTVIFVKGDEVTFKTRHNDDHRAWFPKPDHVDFFRRSDDKWHVFVGELLHSKTPHIKDELYLFDQIVSDGIQLVGMTFAERQDLLHSQWKQVADEGDQIRVHKHVTVAVSFCNGFDLVWDKLKPEDEGLVFKNPNAPLRTCFKADSNGGGQVKCRIPHKNYSF